MVHSCQTKGQGPLLGVVLSLQWAVVAFGGCEAPRAWRIDRFGTCTTESYMWLIVSTMGGLSHGRDIMAFRHVFLVDLLRQAVMGWI
jgi:hypothetical protein